MGKDVPKSDHKMRERFKGGHDEYCPTCRMEFDYKYLDDAEGLYTCPKCHSSFTATK